MPEINVCNMRVSVCELLISLVWTRPLFLSPCRVELRRTVRDLHCLYSSSQAILKLIQSVRTHFVTVTEWARIELLANM